jgi:hypothetical protein
MATVQAFSRLNHFNRHHAKNLNRNKNSTKSYGKQNLMASILRKISVQRNVCNQQTCNKCSKVLERGGNNIRCENIMRLDGCCKARLMQRKF